ncbi:unnamed protein product [Durusdinium trenchii]|uniref:EF-hand domain-containing protein n=1 Tax=Durusdinium trenchii TaxID=1381693 RepID=A0ABP0RCU9_9DINO
MGCNLITFQDLDWLDRWQPSEFLAADPSLESWVELKDGDRNHSRDLLVKTYQHPLRAWRILDRDSSNRIAWTEFRDVCRKVRYTGDIVGAWRALDADMSGYISMREYDPESEELLTSFKEWADSNFGSVRHCFKALDSDRSGSVTFAELKRACHKMKWVGNVRTLFDCLDIDSADRRNRDAATGKRAISLEEIAFLDSWNVEPRPEVAEMEDTEMERDALAEAEAKRVLSVDLLGRLGGPVGLFMRLKREPQSLPGQAKQTGRKPSVCFGCRQTRHHPIQTPNQTVRSTDAPMNRRPDLAFPREILSRSDRGLFLEKNRLQNGELWMKSAAALPGKERFHVTKQQDEDWWLRHNNRASCKPDPSFSFYQENPLLKRPLSRDTWQQQGRRKASHERRQFIQEASRLLRDPARRREMEERYAQVMRSSSLPTLASLRPHSSA